MIEDRDPGDEDVPREPPPAWAAWMFRDGEWMEGFEGARWYESIDAPDRDPGDEDWTAHKLFYPRPR